MSNWKQDSLTKHVSLVTKGTTPTSIGKQFQDNGINFIKAESITDAGMFISSAFAYIDESTHEILKRSQLQNGDILFSIAGVLGRVAVVNRDILPANTNQAIAIIRLSSNSEIEKDFLKHLLNSEFVKEQIRRINVQAAQANFSLADINRLQIQYPKEPNEQSNIARILSTADAVIEKTQAAIAKYKAIKQGMLQDLFTRGIDLNTNKLRPRYQEAPELYKEGKLGWIPREWEVEEIGNYSFVTKLAGFEYTLYFDYSKSGPIIAVRALNIKEGKLNLDNIHTIPQETSNYLTRSQLQKGDLVISYVGTVGEVAVIPESNKFHLAPNVAKISVDKNEVNPFYLNQFLNSHIGQKEIYKLIGATTQSALSMGNLRMVNFLKPEIEEQKEIYNRLQSIDNNIQTEQAYLQKMQNLKKGLMEDLLSGRKQVKINEATTV